MAEVALTRSASWAVRAAVTLTRAASWNVAYSPSVTISRPVRWAVAATVEAAAAPTWSVASTPAAVKPARAPFAPFARLHVDYLSRGGARLSWELSPRFFGPTPYTFQLQVGGSDDPAADDWVDVGDPLVDGYALVDDTRRSYGKTRTPGYRVKLTDAAGTQYLSDPASTFGDLDWRDWRLANEIVRKEQLRHRWQVSPPGFLYKRRRAGALCTRCLSAGTQTATDSECPVCLGTARVGGYFPPLAVTFADVSPEQSKERRSPGGLGMEQPAVITGRFVGWPLPAAQDVWVHRTADLRYALGGLTVKAQLRGYPLVVDVEMRRLPPEDVAYTLPRPTADQEIL